MSRQQASPIILCFSGHDPIGGAGIQADIEAIAAQSAHAATLITALTVQDTRNVQRIEPVAAETLREAASAVLKDLPVAAFKIGLLGSAEIAQTVANIIRQHPGIPLVLDPVLAAGGGKKLSDDRLLEVMRKQLLPLATLLTPNSLEARQLSGEEDLDLAAQQLLSMGCKNVLITGTHEATDRVYNTLYTAAGQQVFESERLPGDYHGSGCTLAATLAARLALGEEATSACHHALAYTEHCLRRAHSPGHGQSLPGRIKKDHEQNAIEDLNPDKDL
ncbi:bifunctional hydroxymethylpyrimidine kinase/phosphomethylpyrimidine kinase [Sulfuriflexus mobilis]|uniref:bifunctional hydroxymethylpyrimidine kinase/phosphomethylpyrimidine kinase n=1 Tax=Sulfuriflexus mobilis TaxID=1811807 RepID=UPI000F828D20|nr:bifunctional hydroxymethylpyrimidine kinase/phosphomethylpyrimidine kinase [Sulfuriflexus mobilis]